MKTNLDAIFNSNKKAEESGKWFVISDQVEFKMKRFGGANRIEIDKLNAKYIGKFQKLINKGLLDKDVEIGLYVKVFVEACMVDWKGLRDDAGNEISFSKANAEDLFKKMPELLEYTIELASDKNEYKDIEEMGNS